MADESREYNPFNKGRGDDMPLVLVCASYRGVEQSDGDMLLG